MKSYRQFRTKLLRNMQVKKAYEDLAPEFAFMRMMKRKVASALGTKVNIPLK